MGFTLNYINLHRIQIVFIPGNNRKEKPLQRTKPSAKNRKEEILINRKRGDAGTPQKIPQKKLRKACAKIIYRLHLQPHWNENSE